MAKGCVDFLSEHFLVFCVDSFSNNGTVLKSVYIQYCMPSNFPQILWWGETAVKWAADLYKCLGNMTLTPLDALLCGRLIHPTQWQETESLFIIYLFHWRVIHHQNTHTHNDTHAFTHMACWAVAQACENIPYAAKNHERPWKQNNRDKKMRRRQRRPVLFPLSCNCNSGIQAVYLVLLITPVHFP